MKERSREETASDIAEIARGIATRAHTGQTDKSGAPYIQHPAAVVSILTRAPGFDEFTRDEQEVAIAMAWLHDVLEDTSITSHDLQTQGMPAAVVEGVIALTHLPKEPRLTYYSRVKGNSLARLVKMADMAHNASPERLLRLDPDTRARLEQKYALGATVLTANAQESHWFSELTGVVPHVEAQETR